METTELRDLLKDILCDNCWEDIDKKARAVFTTICIMEEIDEPEDKKEQDKYLKYLYDESSIKDLDISFLEFKSFMVKDLQ
jgi:hypothetical protein